MATKKFEGHIITPRGAIPLAHELAVAAVLVRSSYNVEFIAVKTVKTADILYRGLEWEIKSPIGGSRHTIENNLRNALKQSVNLIFDLRRLKIEESRAIGEIERQVKMMSGFRNVLVITKEDQIRKIKGLTKLGT